MWWLLSFILMVLCGILAARDFSRGKTGWGITMTCFALFNFLIVVGVLR